MAIFKFSDKVDFLSFGLGFRKIKLVNDRIELSIGKDLVSEQLRVFRINIRNKKKITKRFISHRRIILSKLFDKI
jgi:hypothetical protein